MKWLLAALYVGAILVANITAMWFIGPVAIGTLFFGAVFTLRDRLHHAGGRRLVYAAIGVAAVASAGLVWLGGVEWRILVADVMGLVLSESADTEVYQRLRARRWGVRVLASNSVSIPLDTLLFNLIAFLGVLPAGFIAALCLTDIIIKAVSSGVIALWCPNSFSATATTAILPE